ncbi:MAG: RNA polymerase sigma factor [Lachnospiraceae bacterium]|nr:RNA polymerase sigma factor [Lachnospiraceae bacterium]
MDDVQLIDLYFARNEAALSETQTRYGKYLKTIARRIVRSEEDTDEIANDVYMALWRAIPPKRPDNLKAFIAKIARNLALARVQKDTRLKRGSGVIYEAIDELAETLPSGSTPAEELEAKELSGLISSYLRSQPLDKRNLFIQRYFYLLSMDDLSTQSGMSVSNVKVTLMRMRNSLREYLEKEGYRL